MTFDKILDDKRTINGVYDLDGFNDYIDNEQGN
jgi:hypothetical protein